MSNAAVLTRDRLSALASPALNTFLARESAAPIIVAFSGGGDSLSLLLAAKTWADGARRRLIAITVDHRLQADGADWAAWCAQRAARLGLQHRTLRWRGDKPRTGIPAAARLARHRLIAEAARAEGARVILMGHTADDCLEAAFMRGAGAWITAPRVWGPSPVWPNGRGLFILRPLLGARRAELRRLLHARNETWIDDPANLDPDHPRTEARARASHAPVAPLPGAPVDLTALLRTVEFGPAGDVTLPASILEAAREAERRAFLSAAVVCVSGAERIPRRARIDAILSRLRDPRDLVATLGGVRLSRAGDLIRIVRQIGDRRGGAAATAPAPTSDPSVWDGRFEIQAKRPGLTVRYLDGVAARLTKPARQHLRDLDRAVRGALPALVDAGGQISCPVLLDDPLVLVKNLVPDRLAAACGAVENEAAIWRVAKTVTNP